MRSHYLLLGVIALISCNRTQESAEPQLSQEGVYTLEQAESVINIYNTDCAQCHATNLRGTEGGNALVGNQFLMKWSEKSVKDLIEYTKSTMPLSNPGTYDDKTYASLVAYILRFNKYAPGEMDLDQSTAPDTNLSRLERDENLTIDPPKSIEEPIRSVEAEWLYHRGDLASTNYSTLSQIDDTNVGNLKIAWRWKSDNYGPTPEYYMKTTPIMADGILYVTAGMRRTVVAINGLTGETLWMYRKDEGERTGYVPRQNSGRGVSYWENESGSDKRVVYITPGYQLISLDANTGLPIQGFGKNGVVDLKTYLEDNDDPFTARIGSTSPPVIVNGVIVVGSCFAPGLQPPSRNQVRGDIMAFDAETGKKLWTFHTIPQEGEFGNETWENDSWRYTGNTGVWTSFSADPELGYVYLPVEAATGDFYGGHRPGDNLFSQSIICLDAKTGKRIWHFQTIHHDIWDYDLPAPPILTDITVDDQKIKALAQVTKQAFVYVLNRETGEPVWPIIEKEVPPSDVPGEKSAPTQPFPTRPAAFDRQGVTVDDLIDFTPEIKEMALKIYSGYKTGPLYTPVSVRDSMSNGTLILPSIVGGANWQGGVFDPESGILYVSSTTKLEALELYQDREISDMNYVMTLSDMGEGFGGPFGLPLVKPPWGRITAIDLNSGEHMWVIANSGHP